MSGGFLQVYENQGRDVWIGLKLEGDQVTLVRVLDRKEIYRRFP